jgi:imidazole glycerol-phosphate synthase subunit HisH
LNLELTSSSRTVIVDCGTGNLNSVKRALDRMRVSSVISSSSDDLQRADKIILPGIGHFGRAISNLADLGLLDALNEAVLAKRTPVLGICLGMELMAKSSEEGNVPGLGWLNAETIRFDPPEGARFKVPHMGWNRINIKKPSLLMSGIDPSAEFYFAHSYHLKVNDDSDLLSETDYGISFPSAIEKDNIFGVQYHPEKSHDAGARLIRNFVDM